MKKICLLIISFIIFASNVKAFSIDVDKIEIKDKGSELTNMLDKKYDIDGSDFDSNIYYDAKAQKLAKELIKIVASSKSKQEKISEFGNYEFISKTNGFDTITGSIFINVFFDEVEKYDIKYSYIKNIRTVSFNENDVMSFVYMPKCIVDGEEKDIVMSFWLKVDEGEYKIYYPWLSIESDLEDYFDRVTNKENNKQVLGETYNKIVIGDEEEKVSDELLTEIYINNVDSVIQVTSMADTGNNGYGSGFFIREGIVVISWSLFKDYLNGGNLLYINDHNDVYEVDGVVALDVDYDIAILKLDKEVGKKVEFAKTNDMKSGDYLFTINSKINTGFSINYGNYVNVENGTIESLFPVSSSDVGGALFNKDGKVIGFATNEVLNSDLSYGHSTDYLIELQNILSKEDFNKIASTSLDKFKEKYYLNINEEKTYNNIPDKIWDKYKKVGKLDSITLPLIKGSYKDGIVSLRYGNNVSNYIESMYFVSDYVNSLEEDGYKLTYSDDVKKIYTGKDYKVVIKEDLNYLIIIIMEV
jgi:hypothetical protein